MESQAAQAPVLEPETLKQIDDYLEAIYPESMNAGSKLAWLNFTNSQIRGLETLVLSVTRFSEIMNYIKNQAGKDKRGQWSQAAPSLLEQLESIERQAGEIGKEEPWKILDIKMRLARGWAKQVVAHFFYASLSRKEDL